jgi:hypothetical protein
MTDTTPTPSTEETSFITSGKEDTNQADSTYNDFFQENGDGNISIGKKTQKSWLEITTTILGYMLPVFIVLTLLWSFHVYIQRGGWAQAIKENYKFLCPYLNYAVTLPSDEHKCDPLGIIESSYNKKRSDIETEIIAKLNEYIPIKLTKSILLGSPERKFAETVYDNKLHMDVVMRKFEEVRNSAKSLEGNNSVCNGISISGDGMITTQCTIYGNSSGNDDENGNLGSARIEALRFINTIADTAKSQFILLNPPTSLSMESVDTKDFSKFVTRTTLSIQAKYVPFNK